jgi:hypothetical protein
MVFLWNGHYSKPPSTFLYSNPSFQMDEILICLSRIPSNSNGLERGRPLSIQRCREGNKVPAIKILHWRAAITQSNLKETTCRSYDLHYIYHIYSVSIDWKLTSSLCVQRSRHRHLARESFSHVDLYLWLPSPPLDIEIDEDTREFSAPSEPGRRVSACVCAKGKRRDKSRRLKMILWSLIFDRVASNDRLSETYLFLKQEFYHSLKDRNRIIT